MTSALIAVDPTSKKGKSFERFCSILRLYQQSGILSQTSVASIIHASLYSVPTQWYREMRSQLAKEALDSVTESCNGHFEFDSAKVLISEDHSNESLVSQLTKYGRRTERSLLLLSSNDRTGLPHWILGSFAETATLTAKLPVLVVKPSLDVTDFSKEARFILAVDAHTRVSKKQLRWIVNLARPASAQIDIIYVEPRPRPVLKWLQGDEPQSGAEENLNEISRELSAAGVKTKVLVLKESKSIAHTITDYAEKRKAWLSITINTERSTAKKLFLGSTARRVLSLTERPFLSLRLE